MKVLYDESRCIAACKHIARGIVWPLLQRESCDHPSFRQKDDASVVTDADLAIEQAIRAFLGDAFPDFGLLGQEYGATRSEAEYVWTIDPLDGTEAYIAGVPLFGTLLAVLRQADGSRTPVLGAAYLPVQDQLMLGNRLRTTIDGRSVRVPRFATGAHKTLTVGNLSRLANRLPAQDYDGLLRLAGRFDSTQTWGDCLGYFNLIEGRSHLHVDAGLGIEDIAPLEPIILGAGGSITTVDGELLSSVLSGLDDVGDVSPSFNVLAAADGNLHRELLVALRR